MTKAEVLPYCKVIVILTMIYMTKYTWGSILRRIGLIFYFVGKWARK